MSRKRAKTKEKFSHTLSLDTSSGFRSENDVLASTLRSPSGCEQYNGTSQNIGTYSVTANTLFLEAEDVSAGKSRGAFKLSDSTG